MAFAAVVSLFAKVNKVDVAAIESAPKNTGRLKRSLCLVAIRKTPMIIVEIRFLPPLIAREDQGTLLMKSPQFNELRTFPVFVNYLSCNTLIFLLNLCIYRFWIQGDDRFSF